MFNQSSNELEKLKLQLTSMNALIKTNESQYNQQINQLKQQCSKQANDLEKNALISQKRKEEIEKWRSQYSGYVTPEQ